MRTELVIPVEGMTCSSCEKTIVAALSALDGVNECDANRSFRKVRVVYDETIIDKHAIIACIEQLGYQCETKETWKESLVFYCKVLIGMASAWIIVSNLFPAYSLSLVTRDTSRSMLFFAGLLTSVHCIMMCGSIGLAQGFESSANGKFSGLQTALLYNLGRVVSYTVLGGIIGGIGSVFRINTAGSSWISIFVGVVMMGMALQMLGWLRPVTAKIRIPFIPKIKKAKQPFLFGLFHAFMPCGPLQAMQVYALASGSVWSGAVSMFLFSLGTVPLMLAIGVFGSFLSRNKASKIYRVGALLVLFMGLSMTNRGLVLQGYDVTEQVATLIGWKEEGQSKAAMKDGTSVVVTKLQKGSYEPIVVYQNIPVEWTIEVDAADLNGCNNEIMIPEYNIRVPLKEGANVIRFTPTKTGTFVYTCWMGMIRSTITVQTI